MHIQHVNQLKQKLRGYSLDPFSKGNARHMTTGKELDPNMIEGLLNPPKLGNEKCKEFVQDRLVEGKVDFFQPIKRLMLSTGLKKVKKQPKAVSILKQDRQAFRTLLTKSINLETAFQHPLTEVPLSLATPGGELRQAPKHLLRNDIIEEANDITNVCPENARWLIDGIAAMRCVKARETYKEWLRALLKFSTPPLQSRPLSVEIINNTYRKDSVKSGTRQRRCEESSRIHIQGYDQKMLQGNAWNSVFNNIENKTELVELTANFFQTTEGRKSLSVPLIFTCGSQLPLSKESKTASNPPSQKRARYAAEFQVDNNEISEETREFDYIFLEIRQVTKVMMMILIDRTGCHDGRSPLSIPDVFSEIVGDCLDLASKLSATSSSEWSLSSISYEAITRLGQQAPEIVATGKFYSVTRLATTQIIYPRNAQTGSLCFHCNQPKKITDVSTLTIIPSESSCQEMLKTLAMGKYAAISCNFGAFNDKSLLAMINVHRLSDTATKVREEQRWLNSMLSKADFCLNVKNDLSSYKLLLEKTPDGQAVLDILANDIATLAGCQWINFSILIFLLASSYVGKVNLS
eukprot:gene5059-5718_t